MRSYAIVGRLAWKEYRVLRVLWLFHFGFMVWALWMMLHEELISVLPNVVAVPLQILGLYALGCGATMFALEREEETDELLRRLPASANVLLAGKVLYFAASGALLLLLAGIVGTLLRGSELFEALAAANTRQRGTIAFYADTWAQCQTWGLAVLEAFAWSVLFSLLVRRPVVAAILGVTGALFGVGLAIAMDEVLASWGWRLAVQPTAGSRTLEQLNVAWLSRLGVLGTVMLLDFWLVKRWYRGLIQEKKFEANWSWPLWKGPSIELIDRVLRWPLVRRLQWQQVRQLAWPWLGILLLVVTACEFGGDSIYDGTMEVAVTILVTLVASTTFLVDQEGNHVRFLAQRGISPAKLWWSRIATSSFGATLLCLGLWFMLWLIHEFTDPIHGDLRFREPPRSWLRTDLGLSIWHLVLPLSWAFACGQWCSLFIRANLLASIVSLLLLAGCWGWWLLMNVAMVPVWWSVGPIAVVFLLSSRLRMTARMLEQTTWRARWSGTWPLLLLVALAVGASVQRALSIPAVEPGFEVAEFARPLTKSERETSSLYTQAMRSLVDDSFPRIWDAPIRTGQAASSLFARRPFGLTHTEAQQTWYEKNLAALPLAVQAAKRGVMRDDRTLPGDLATARSFAALVDLVRFEGERLQMAGHWEDAWQYYLYALRIAAQGRNRALPGFAWSDRMAESDAYESMVEWCDFQGQTSARILAALQDFEREQPSLRNEREVFKYHHLYMMGVLDGDDIPLANSGMTERADRSVRFLLWIMPGERIRARRLTNYSTAHVLQLMDDLEVIWSGRRPYPPDMLGFIQSENVAAREFFWQVLNPWGSSWNWWAERMLYDVLRNESDQRALRTRMALLAWRLDHGELPSSLDALVPDYLEQVPLNPWAPGLPRYYPTGMERDLLDQGQRLLPAGTPVLWMWDFASPGHAGQPQTEMVSAAYGIPALRSVD